MARAKLIRICVKTLQQITTRTFCPVYNRPVIFHVASQTNLVCMGVVIDYFVKLLLHMPSCPNIPD